MMQDTIWVQLEESPGAGVTARWRLAGDNDDGLHSAGFEEFKIWLRAQQASNQEVLKAVLLLSGEQVISRSVVFAANEKKHLQKLLPFMLESQLAVDLPQVHVAHAQLKDLNADADKQSASVAYTDKKQLQWRIADLEALGLEVEQVFSIPAILPASETNWSLQLDSDICHLHAGNFLCASIEPEMVGTLIDIAIVGLKPESPTPSLMLLAVDDTPLSVAEHAGIKEAGIKISHQRVAHAWSGLHVDLKNAVNLRQGEFAAPLRANRYWKQWRVPAIAAMLAISAVLVTAIVETQINQYRFRALEARIEQRYREVMPEGVLVDAVQQLSAQVSQRRSAGSAQSLITMLNAMLEPFENADSLSLHGLSYNIGTQASGVSAEIQLNISAPSTAEILQLGENLTAAGWSAQAQNISRAGDSQQANLIVRGEVL